MSDFSDGGAAFQRPVSEIQGTRITYASQSGMSLRDYFAGQALAGLIADPSCVSSAADLAGASYAVADAMLAKRKKEAPNA